MKSLEKLLKKTIFNVWQFQSEVRICKLKFEAGPCQILFISISKNIHSSVLEQLQQT